MQSPLLISAPPTAFGARGEIDFASTARIFEHTLDGGVDAMFVNGTTGEFAALDRAERRQLLELAVGVAGPARVIAHVGSASPFEARLLALDACELGIGRLSVLTPFYMPASLDGIRRQIGSVREAAPEEQLFLYLFPDRTGVEVAPETAASLLEEFDLAGAKLSIAGTDYLAAVAASPSSQSRTVLSGNDGLMREVLAAGGGGVVSGISASVPAPFARLKQAIAQGDAEAADQWAEKVNSIVPVLGPSISALKLSLHLQGVIDSPMCRMAIDDPSSELAARVRTVVGQVEALSASAG
ncbi:dihydrodipicolinate synthase family protein [Sinomonas soli]